MTISDADLEHRLRDLRLRADEIAPAPLDLAERVRDRHRALRRREFGLAAAAVAAVLVLGGIPVVGSALHGDGRHGQTAGPSTGTTVQSAPVPDLYDLPTRGSLADDAQWLADVAALEWAPVDPGLAPPGTTLPDPPRDTRRVAFAGDVPSGRVALVLGLDGHTTQYAWFTGPAGARASEMTLATVPRESGLSEPLALVDAATPSPARVTLVVVAVPGDTVDVGLPRVVDAAGRVSAPQRTLPGTDGVVATEIPSSWLGWPADLRVSRGGQGALGLLVQDTLRMHEDQVPSTAPENPRGLAIGLDPALLDGDTARQLQSYGLTAEEAHPTVLAAGPLGARVGQYGVLIGMSFPSGATGTWLMTYTPADPQATSMRAELPHAPAGTALLDRVIAVRAMAGVLVSAPTGARAEVLDATGTVRDTIPLLNGSGTGPLSSPDAATTVRVLDSRGVLVGETSLQKLGG